MIFSLEALDAKQGDCLLLHFGERHNPRVIVIDGGPAGVFEGSLHPRLLQLRERRGIDNREFFETDLLIVSHVDDDHIRGILEWFVNIAIENWTIAECWFNSFPEVLRTAERFHTAASPERINLQKLAAAVASKQAKAVLASVPQGRELRQQVLDLEILLNGGKDALFVPDNAPPYSKDGITLRLIAPNRKAVETLRRKWDAAPVKTADLDNSVENLSSLVVMAEAGQRRILLSGDARGDHIIEGLEAAGLLTNGSCEMDILKLPHHGSSRNCTSELFSKVRAHHYVISANGKFNHPDSETLCRLASARGESASYSIHMTNEPDANDESKEGRKLFASVEEAKAKYPWLKNKLEFGQATRAIRIDLLDQLE